MSGLARISQEIVEEIICQAIERLPERFRWAPHNVVAHPVSEVLSWFGWVAWGDWLHAVTVPVDISGMRQH